MVNVKKWDTIDILDMIWQKTHCEELYTKTLKMSRKQLIKTFKEVSHA